MAKIRIDDIGNVFEEMSNTFVKEMTLEIHSRMVDKAPVSTGRLRGSISVSINSPANDGETLDKSGIIVKSDAKSTVGSYESGDTVYISVTAPYAYEIEMGSSDKAPNGFFRTTLEEMDAIIREVAIKLGR